MMQKLERRTYEDIEGLDEITGREAEPYPLDSLMVRSETRTVSEVLKRIEKKRYILNPDFQRAFVWPTTKQSKLIESCLMRIPLPVLYVSEADDGRVIVVDGLQRLTTFQRFISNSLKLDLGSDHPLTGKRFNDLPIALRERIEDTQLTLYILDRDAPPRARLDIFERVNSGMPLTRQQMRNAIYGGRATRWLADAANSKLFKDVTGGSLRSDTMRDREAINRFCAFKLLGWSAYLSGDMDDFLARVLRMMNHESQDLSSLQEKFTLSLKHNHALFGKHAFRKSIIEEKRAASRSVINIALFDVCSVLFAEINSVTIQKFGKEIKSAIVALLRDDEFSYYITYSTNSTRQVRGRFMLAEEALEGYLE